MYCKIFIRTFPSTEECDLFSQFCKQNGGTYKTVPGVNFDSYRNKHSPNISTVVWNFWFWIPKKIERLIEQNIQRFTATLSPKTMSFSGEGSTPQQLGYDNQNSCRILTYSKTTTYPYSYVLKLRIIEGQSRAKNLSFLGAPITNEPTIFLTQASVGSHLIGKTIPNRLKNILGFQDVWLRD